MNKNIVSSLVPVCFIWFGLVVGISFLEAPAKFTSEMITREAALDLGVIVFGYLNKVEIILMVMAFIFCMVNSVSKNIWLGISAVGVILMLQTLWLIPVLAERAESIIAGRHLDPSYHHTVYVAFEIIKLTMLLIVGFSRFHHWSNYNPEWGD